MKYLLCIFMLFQLIHPFEGTETFARGTPQSGPDRPILTEALMCEEIKEFVPINPGVIFSKTNDRVYCLTAFDLVRQTTFIYHDWFFRDTLVTRQKLSLKPPRWSTFSRIHLRDADRGPWRVEIRDREGKIIKVLRFSITE